MLAIARPLAVLAAALLVSGSEPHEEEVSCMLQLNTKPSVAFGEVGGANDEQDALDAQPCKNHGRRHSSDAFLETVATTLSLPPQAYTVSGTHFAQGYIAEDAKDINVAGMKADCDNINLNMKLSASFRDDVFGPGLKGFFYKCEKVGDKNKYWFTIASDSLSTMKKLCDSSTAYPVVYDSQHDTYWQDKPFTCDGKPTYSKSLADSAFLGRVAESLSLPAKAYTVSGTHFAQGYIAENAKDINVAGMKADCDNINLNMKLSASFRSDVFGPGMKGFFYKCEKVGDQNKYWFTISSRCRGDVKKLCDSSTVYPIVYDSQHDTYWRDEPFACEGQ